jgi:hypothetical protein
LKLLLLLLLLLVCDGQGPTKASGCLLLVASTACFTHHIAHKQRKPHTSCWCSAAAGGSNGSSRVVAQSS